MYSKMAAIAAAMVIAAGVSLAASWPAEAQLNPACESNFGTKTPVLMVHGWGSAPSVWGDNKIPSSMVARLEKDDVTLFRFDYNRSNKEWVTSEAIGPTLARRIDCLSQNSRKSGGTGKVVIVAHSMGGLATRFAVNQTIEGRKVVDSMGLVVTIGTPHEGTLLANLCDELAKVNAYPELCQGSAAAALKVGSKELRELPPFPPSVPMKAISGDVTINAVILTPPPVNVPMYVRVPTSSDLVVQVSSASRFATESGKGDGGKRFACDSWVPIPNLSDAPCEHNNLVNNSAVQQEVKASIERYLTSTEKPPLPPGRKVTLFNKLSLTYLNTWKKGFSMPGTMEDIVDGTTCTASSAECPHIMVINLDSPEARAQYGSNPMAKAAHDCLLEQDESGHKPGQQPKLMSTEVIDDEPVEYYEQIVCPSYLGSNEKAHFWYAKKRGVLIDASSVGLTGSPLAFDQLKAVVANIDWL